MRKRLKAYKDEFKKYAAILESENLGVIDIENSYYNSSHYWKHITGKWRAYDSKINDVMASAGLMEESYQTARSIETRDTFSDLVKSWEDLHKGLDALANAQTKTFNSKTPDFYYLEDDEPLCDEFVLEELALSLVATPKEAELADRERGSICGLDGFGRPLGLTPPRKNREPGKDWRQRTRKNIIGDNAGSQAGPEWKPWRSPNIPPHATSDAGNGPLSIKDKLGPDPLPAPDTDEPVRMSPVVDTLSYLPGRSPFQMSRITQNNSDITG